MVSGGAVDLDAQVGVEGDAWDVDSDGAVDGAVHPAGGRAGAQEVQVAVDVGGTDQRAAGAVGEGELAALDGDRHLARGLDEREVVHRERLAGDGQHDVVAGDHELGAGGGEDRGEGARETDAGDPDDLDGAADRAGDRRAEGEVGGAVREADQRASAVAELHPHVARRQVDHGAELLDGDVAAEHLTGSLDHDAGAGDPQVRAGRDVDGDLAVADRERLVHGERGGVQRQGEAAVEVQGARRAEGEPSGELARHAPAGEHEQAVRVTDLDQAAEADRAVGDTDADDRRRAGADSARR